MACLLLRVKTLRNKYSGQLGVVGHRTADQRIVLLADHYSELHNHYTGLGSRGYCLTLTLLSGLAYRDASIQREVEVFLRYVSGLTSDKVIKQDVRPWYTHRSCDQTNVSPAKVIILNLG